MYQMDNKFFTGIDFIDDEHSKLFETTNKAYQIMANDFIHDKFDYIVAILDELKDYASEHFQHEEEYMESINYKRLFTQKIEHAQFIEKIESISLERIDDNQEYTILELLNFLSDWLVEHILEKDKLIGQV